MWAMWLIDVGYATQDVGYEDMGYTTRGLKDRLPIEQLIRQGHILPWGRGGVNIGEGREMSE